LKQGEECKRGEGGRRRIGASELRKEKKRKGKAV
jgi:hypothetical protein